MSAIMQEIATYQREFQRLVRQWNSLPTPQRRKLWAAYTEMLDQGDAAYHPYDRVLINVWCEGLDVGQPLLFEPATA